MESALTTPCHKKDPVPQYLKSSYKQWEKINRVTTAARVSSPGFQEAEVYIANAIHTGLLTTALFIITRTNRGRKCSSTVKPTAEIQQSL